MTKMIEVPTMEALRGYLRELRVGRNVSQEELADVMGLARQSLLDWEKGRIKEIKTTATLKAIQYLHGAASDLLELVDASLEQGIALARQRLSEPTIEFTEEQHQRLDHAARNIPEDQFDEVMRLLEDLQQQNKTGEWLNFGRFLRG